MRTLKLYSIGLLLAILASCSGCTSSTTYDEEENGNEEVAKPNDSEDDIENTSFSDSLIHIVYGNDVTVYNPWSDKGVIVDVNGGDVTVTSTAENVVYALSGTTTNGSFKIYSDYQFKLQFDGVSITNSDGPAINIQSHKRVFVVLSENTTNILTDGASYASSSEDMKAAFFSEGQLIFTGSGSLSVKSNYKHGICSDDYIRIQEGSITVTGAVSDGVHTGDALLVEGGNLSVTCVGDGFQSEDSYITISGGTMTIRTTGEKGHGLNATGDIEISGGSVNVNVSGVASKGIKSDVNIAISGGTIDVVTSGTGVYDSTEKDVSAACGIKCEGTCTISGETTQITCASSGKGGKGMSIGGVLTIDDATVVVKVTGATYSYSNSLDSKAKGIRCESNLIINSGSVSVVASGGEGSEGIESKNVLTINGGTVEVTAYDDGINASKGIVINGGYIYSYATQNDGIDSNGTLTINGGVIVASGTSSPEEGFDCDQNTFGITGGTMIGTGGATSTPTTSACKQYAVVYGGSGTQGKIFRVEKSDGTEIITYAVPRTLSSMTYLFSAANLAAGSYTIYQGGSVSGGTEFHGLYIGATYTQGSATSTSFTVSSVVTTTGSASGGGGFPGGGGMPW